MALLKKLKEKLGIGSGSSERDGGDTEVTVEREAGTKAASGADATEPPSDSADEEPSTESADEEPSADDESDPDIMEEESFEESDEDAAAAETEAAASTDSLVDEEASQDPHGAAEPGEAAGPPGQEKEVSGGDAETVESIKGIGPAYAERLGELGIETVADLAAADAEEVAEKASVGKKRAATWIERASEF